MATRIAKLIRNTGQLARACSLVVIVALLVAPVCAPLCAARVCPQALASMAVEAPCHLAGMTHGNALELHAVQNCGASELPAAVLTSSVKNDAWQASRASTIDVPFGILPREFFSPRLQQSERNVAGPLSPHISASSLADQVLRI